MFSTLEPDLDNASVGTYRLIDVILPLGVVRAVFVYNSESGSQGARLHGFVSHFPGKPFQFEYFVRKGERIMNASVAIQVLPQASDDEELIRIVDEVIDYIKSTGLNYYVGPCETAIEGDYDQLMDIVKECQHIAIRAGAPSVAAYIKVSYKPEGDVLTIEKKVTKHHR